MGIVNFQVWGASIYDRIFDRSEEGPFKFSAGHMKVIVIKNCIPGSLKLYVL